ncbi:amidohydrolase [Candidatus Bathyarchaeota archaeon]|nr:MAG: amidohydrolase [Candidatus Bathyarchaeota archaeon]
MVSKIDCHTHIGKYNDVEWSSEFAPWNRVTPEVLIKFLDDLGVDKAILLPTYSWDIKNKLPTERVIDICNEYPDRLLPFCVVEVREEGLENKLIKYRDMGCLGVGEHTSKIEIDHKLNRRLYRACGRLELPILIHMAISPSDEYGALDTPELEGLERVLEEFSDVDFIMHGPGWWRAISARIEDPMEPYPTGKIEEPGRVVELLEDYDNVYGDLSARSGYNALSRDLEFARTFLRRFNRKLLYGTDMECFFRPEHSLMALLDENLTEGERENIYYKNVKKLLKI